MRAGAARTLAGLNGVNVRYYINDHFHIGLNLGVATFSFRYPDFGATPVPCATNPADSGCAKKTRTIAYIGSSLEGVYWILGKPGGNLPFQADFGIGGRLGFQHSVNSTDIANDLDDPLQFTAEIPLMIQLNIGENFSIVPEFGAVPGRAPEPGEPIQLRLLSEVDAGDGLELETGKPPSRHPWAWLLARVFAVDIMACPKCEGRMALNKIANTAEDIAVVLAQVGLGPRPPPRPHPALPGQLEFDFAA